MLRMRQKAAGYRRRLIYEWNLRRNAVAAEKRKAVLDEWFTHLAANPPDVLVGANPIWGGVRHHIHAIEHFSSLKVSLAPGEELFRMYPNRHIASEFYEEFTRFKASNIKVVHSHVFPWFIEWCRERKKSGTRWIHTYHLNYYPEHSADVLAPWQKGINKSLLTEARFADVCLSVSKWQAEELLREHGITTQYLPNGVDVAMCDAAKASRFTKKNGLEDFILYVGRNDPVKNPVEFVHLAEQMPDRRFVMIGGGLSESALRKDWQVEVPDNLDVLGSISHTEVQDAIAACSVLVVTSKREGLPTIVMEAMAQRKVVVVPNEAGCMEVVGQGEAGLIYSSGHIDDLVDKTSQALANTSLGSLARKRILTEYDWRVIAPKLDAIYQGKVD